MGNHHIRRGKPILTAHQKQIRFFIGLFVVICALLAIAFFWLVNRSSFFPH
jgi:multidrug resistance efflux pump